ncbi:MAG TPA: 2,4'-dihydroxyacetophenone dioxygenase family protein [Acidimicrobiales bacterium]|nr:2,4'-dihydroxyacetophenone dioxygenase family protein [Acidimicrobiales bacterium]
MTTAFQMAPTAVHRAETDLPFVTFPDGVRMQLLQVDLATGVWVVRSLFPAGVSVQTHKHTGHVYAFTRSGHWYYRESPEAVNVAGSYLFEPAGSVHTLHAPPGNEGDTDVCFVIHGAILNLTAEGDVEAVIDAAGVLSSYRALCRSEHATSDPPVVLTHD